MIYIWVCQENFLKSTVWSAHTNSQEEGWERRQRCYRDTRIRVGASAECECAAHGFGSNSSIGLIHHGAGVHHWWGGGPLPSEHGTNKTVMARFLPRLRDSSYKKIVSLPSEDGTASKRFHRLKRGSIGVKARFFPKPKEKSGLDCLMCAIFARQTWQPAPHGRRELRGSVSSPPRAARPWRSLIRASSLAPAALPFPAPTTHNLI